MDNGHGVFGECQCATDGELASKYIFGYNEIQKNTQVSICVIFSGNGGKMLKRRCRHDPAQLLGGTASTEGKCADSSYRRSVELSLLTARYSMRSNACDALRAGDYVIQPSSMPVADGTFQLQALAGCGVKAGTTSIAPRACAIDAVECRQNYLLMDLFKPFRIIDRYLLPDCDNEALNRLSIVIFR
ncbi:hypothetical protein [Paraburkholderia bannensis]|uniref:hypothetical protein n=1 Tax=Paraburkholderia bannensis TaxID=765414 RepID=UPI002AB3087A|nr:hypothetical protein [Paraburkholderia bannensis]